MKQFQGRVVVPGSCTAEALVSHSGFNTLASYQKAILFGGVVLYAICSMDRQPACMLFSMPIDSLAASGAILADVWIDKNMPVIDRLGEEFLSYVRDGMKVTVGDDGLVTVE
jgi:predicted aconitase with swiveling domain